MKLLQWKSFSTYRHMRSSIGFIIISLCILITGCSSNASSEEVTLLEPIKVELSVSSAEVSTEETVHIKAFVTQQGDPVDDADEVRIEIATADGIGMEFEAEHEGEGVYVFDYQFNSAGEYKVISHVTARGLHSMPSAEIVVQDKQ
ncbi:FixH family protein [Neobacillus mesonae]|nr:FixH family protein [Neobacillus mesonae]